MFSEISFAQSDSTKRITFDSLKIKNTTTLSPNSEYIHYNDFIWNDRRTASEVLNEKSGFFVNSKGAGMYNRIYYNGFFDNEMGIFKDGIQINNNYFGIFDPEVISINEIEKIELVSGISSFIYGVNSHGKVINFITKDRFEAKPFSQLRYSQDRYGSLDADASFTIPLSRKFNFLIRANNHTLDGKYTNSDFSAWRTGGRLSWFPSSLWNYKVDFNYSKISRGLNEGLNFIGMDLSQDSIINILKDTKAAVVDPSGREVTENYNASLSLYSGTLGKNSTSSLQVYYNHYYRNYGGAPYAGGPAIKIEDYYYTERLGINLKYDKKIILSDLQRIELTLLNNYYFNSFTTDFYVSANSRDAKSSKVNYGFASGRLNYSLQKFSFTGLFKLEQSFVTNNSQNALSFGGEMKLNITENDNLRLDILSGVNKINYLNVYPAYSLFDKYSFTGFESGIQLNSKNVNVMLGYNSSGDYSDGKVNFDISYGVFNIKSETSVSIKDREGSLPFFSKNDFSYREKLFLNKLDLKLGMNFKFVSNSRYYNSRYLQFVDDRFYSGGSVSSTYYQSNNNKFIADAYIGARIGRANINFTLANIFNNFYYDTFMFPADDRGGFINAVSRFTIVWDFIN